MHIHADRSIINDDKLTSTTKASFNVTDGVENKMQPRDTIELTNRTERMTNVLSTDKGTAAHTTLYVDNDTFQKIAMYSTNHPDTRWSEMGVDENKRWIVVNGQRFESPKSEEEKEMLRRAQMTLFDHLQEYEDNKEEVVKKEEVTLNFLDKNSNTEISTNPKMKNLYQNEKVMDMLKNISKSSKGKITVSF